jgi:hypothetical protein
MLVAPPWRHLIRNLTSYKGLRKLFLILFASLSYLIAIGLKEPAPWVRLLKHRQFVKAPKPAAPVRDRQEQAECCPGFVEICPHTEFFEPMARIAFGFHAPLCNS